MMDNIQIVCYFNNCLLYILQGFINVSMNVTTAVSIHGNGKTVTGGTCDKNPYTCTYGLFSG